MDETTHPIRYAIGDLGPARRHIARLLSGEMPASPGVFREISAAMERCVARLERLDEPGTGTPHPR